MKRKIGRSLIFSLAVIILPLTIILTRLFQMYKMVVISDIKTINGLGIFNSANLLFIDERKTKLYLLKSNFWIRDIVMEKQFPDTILIKLEARNPIAHIKKKESNLYIDEEGVILNGIFSHKNLPDLEISGIPLVYNVKSDWRIIKAAQHLESIFRQGLTVKKMTINNADNFYSIYLDDGAKITVPYQEDPFKIAASLQIIILRFRIEGKKVSKIDFQFEKPVITLSNEEKNYPFTE